NLSIVYEELLNNLLPKFVDNGLAAQQDQIRQWLMKDVPMSQWIRDIMTRQKARDEALANAVALGTGAQVISARMMFDVVAKPTGENLNRIELSELLMSEYLYAKQDWEIERDNLIAQASQSRKALNELTRKLAHITATRQAQLASKYSDAVVRGYSHSVREYMGYLDIASPAEALQNAKDSLRELAMSSLDGSMKVYPVQMTPLDWFQGLSTSFTMEDLTQDPEAIRSQINAKSQQLDTLNAQLVALQMHKGRSYGVTKQGRGCAEHFGFSAEHARTDLFQQCHLDGEYVPGCRWEGRHIYSGRQTRGCAECAGGPSCADGGSEVRAG
ncbi:hypothetical protein C8J57DRAFT_1075307, partial [Mycena rebaudengoi]